jgi:hypothetical protein
MRQTFVVHPPRERPIACAERPPFATNAACRALTQVLSMAVFFVTAPALTRASGSFSQKPRRD